MTGFDYLSIGLLIVFVAANWFAPRRLGVLGMVLVQFALLITYFVLAGIAIDLGRYAYDDLFSIIGLAMQAFLINSLLFPIALVALLRRRRANGDARGFPVVGASSSDSRACWRDDV